LGAQGRQRATHRAPADDRSIGEDTADDRARILPACKRACRRLNSDPALVGRLPSSFTTMAPSKLIVVPIVVLASLRSACAQEITWTTNVVTTSANDVRNIFSIDLDGDGDIDMLTADVSSHTVSWYENDGSQSFTKHDISTSENYAWAVFAIDMDGDGDIDVLSGAAYDDMIVWFENDGSQSFTKHDITTSADGAMDVFAIDMDGDGDIDVLSASYNDDTVAWYENDGSQSFTKNDIATSADGANSVFAIDVDGDGNIDVISNNHAESTIAWYEWSMPADYTYDFEYGTLDGWSTGSAGNSWTLDSGSTSSYNTGPSSAQSNSYYVYTETSSTSTGAAFDLYRTFQADVETVSFYYSMYGATIGSLRVDGSNDGFSTYTTVWSESGDQGTSGAWSQVSLDVTGSGYDSIRFYAIAGSSYTGDIALDYIEVTAGGDYESDDAPTGGWPTAVPIPAPSPEPTTPVPSPVPTTPVPSPVPTTPVPSPVPTTPVPSPVPTTPVPSPVPTALPTWVKEASFPLPLKYHVQRGAGGLSGNEGGLKARMEDGCYGTQAADYDEGKCGPPGSGYAQNSAYGTGTNCNDGFGKCTTDDS